MTLVIVPALQDLGRLRRTHYKARCWKVTPPDFPAAVVRFTDWPQELEIMESDDLGTLFKYSPVGGADSSARQRRVDLQTNNVELSGITTPGVFSDVDFSSGIYLGASVDMFKVDIRTAFLGYTEHARYYVRVANHDGESFNLKCETLESALFVNATLRFGSRCRVALYSLGDGQCNVVKADFTEVGELVISVTSRQKFIVATVAPWTTEADFGQDGDIAFTSGLNTGFTRKIMRSTNLTGANVEIETYRPFPFNVAVPDACDIAPGCNKQPGTEDTVGHCKPRFANMVNFQAEHKQPGRDAVTGGAVIV